MTVNLGGLAFEQVLVQALVWCAGKGKAAGMRRTNAVVMSGFVLKRAGTGVKVGRAETLRWRGLLIIRLLEDESRLFRGLLRLV